MKLINYALPIFLLMVSVTGLAQSDASKPMAPGHGFAPIVYEVCNGKKAGDAVQIKTPDGSVDAVCMETSRGLAAGPGKALGEAHSATTKPVSSQAFDICKGKKDGDVVELTAPTGGKTNALCVATPAGLVARTKGSGHPGQ